MLDNYAGYIHCCKLLNDPTSLLTCVNQSSSIRNTELLQNNLLHFAGPTLSIGIVTYATKEIWTYTAYSFGINAAYAAHNNYHIKLLDPTLSQKFDGYDSRWNKVKVLEEALDPRTGWAKYMDYVMWIDADLSFLDMGLRLEHIVQSYPEAHILASAGTLVI